MTQVDDMPPVNTAKVLAGQVFLEPMQHLSHHKRAFIDKIYFAVVAAGLYPDDIVFSYHPGPFIGRN